MNGPRALYQMVRADFLERVRRYSFLLTLGFSVYLAYAVYAGQVSLQLNQYRGVNNSAWHGSVTALVASVWLSLVGFYIVKNAIQRDRETRVGAILASTPISKSFYTLGKTLSNFAVLASMVFALALASLVFELSSRSYSGLDLVALLLPVLIFGLSAVAVTAALAVLFESLPVLRGGVGNVVYFFLWTALVAVSAAALETNTADNSFRLLTDFSGIAAVMSQMQAQVHQFDPLYTGGGSFSIGGLHATTKTFLWAGFHWTASVLLSRFTMLAVAAILALLASLFFDRFDPARGFGLKANKLPKAKKSTEAELAPNTTETPATRPLKVQTAAQLTPVSRTAVRRRLVALTLAEFRLLLRGHGWWWYAGAAGLIAACLFSPIDVARSGLIVAAWLWPLLAWSHLGTREAQFSTGTLIFSAPRAMPRQLLASYVAGVLLALLTGSGLAMHLLWLRDFTALAPWVAGAFFIPALALALGVVAGTRKPFEALYTAWWYIGPLHHIRPLDFMGTTAQSSTPAGYFFSAALLVLIAYLWRKVRLGRA